MQPQLEVIAALGGFSGIAALITALVQLAGLRKSMSEAMHELKPNHGSSMKDALARIESVQQDHGERLHELRKDVQTLQAKELLS